MFLGGGGLETQGRQNFIIYNCLNHPLFRFHFFFACLNYALDNVAAAAPSVRRTADNGTVVRVFFRRQNTATSATTCVRLVTKKI